MADSSFAQAFDELFGWCRQHNFAGHDPFDALNSKVFQATPFRNSAKARLLWTQVVKRSPLNLRRLALIQPEQNSKGIALFALAALANYRLTKSKAAELEARDLLKELISLRIETSSGVAWSYNFDWQSRNFFAPRGTPTIVPTAFAARALIEAGDAFNENAYLDLSRRVCDFVMHELPRTVETQTEICFSYTPVDETRIFNASLLAAEVMALVGARDANADCCSAAGKTIPGSMVQLQIKTGSTTSTPPTCLVH